MRAMATVVIGFLLATSFGCAMCASPHYCKYAAYGGCRPRADMVHGRVGSIIDPAAEAHPEIAAALPSEPTPANRGDWTPIEAELVPAMPGEPEADGLEDTTFQEFTGTPMLEVAEKPTLELTPPENDDVDVDVFLE